jgi:hypothetical protein
LNLKYRGDLVGWLTPILTRRPKTTWPKDEVGVQAPIHQRTQSELHTTPRVQSATIKHLFSKNQG